MMLNIEKSLVIDINNSYYHPRITGRLINVKDRTVGSVTNWRSLTEVSHATRSPIHQLLNFKRLPKKNKKIRLKRLPLWKMRMKWKCNVLYIMFCNWLFIFRCWNACLIFFTFVNNFLLHFVLQNSSIHFHARKFIISSFIDIPFQIPFVILSRNWMMIVPSP